MQISARPLTESPATLAHDNARYATGGGATVIEAGPPRDKDDDDSTVGVATKAKPKTKKPSQYKVLMLKMILLMLCMEFLILN